MEIWKVFVWRIWVTDAAGFLIRNSIHGEATIAVFPLFHTLHPSNLLGGSVARGFWDGNK